MLFSWPLNGCKLISVSILPSNTHFSENTERAEWERDAPARRERERERERGRTQKTQKSPTQIIVPDRVAPQNRSSSTQIVVPDRVAPQSRLSSTQIVVLDRDLAFAPIAIAAPIGFGDLACRRTQSQPDYEFFFPRCYLCFWIKEWDYNICLATEKIWENVSKK